MRLGLASLLVLSVLASVHAEAQYQFGYPAQYAYFRGGFPQPSYDVDQTQQRSPAVKVSNSADPRFFFTTLTVTLTTSTSTTFVTSTTTCTTSTSTLKVCTPSGRRRRGISLDKEGGGLYYNDEEDDDGMFLPSPKAVEAPAPVVEVQQPVRTVRETPPVPYVVQPGFQAPEGIGSGRFLLAFGTSTTTSTSTTTLTSSLTATCKSTTAYQTCGSTGK